MITFSLCICGTFPPLICWWTSSLALFPCCCEQGNSEQDYAHISVIGLESFGYVSEAAQRMRVVILFLVFRETTTPFSKVAVPRDTSANED